MGEKLEAEASRWLSHCEELRAKEELGDAQLFVITRRCLAPSWAAVSYVNKGEKRSRTKGEKIEAIAEPTKWHPDVFEWTSKGAAPDMLWQTQPAAADVLPQLESDPDSTLPLDICVAVGGLVISYERTKVKKASPVGEAAEKRSLVSTLFTRMSRKPQ